LYRMKMKIKYAEICKTAKDMVRGKTMSIWHLMSQKNENNQRQVSLQ
jgi:hypothetical protein